MKGLDGLESIHTTAILLAGGSGTRMADQIRKERGDLQEDIPKKQYMELLGRPMLTYALDAFEASRVDEVILVISPEDETYVREEILKPYGYQKVTAMVEGGSERYLSVYQGLLALEEERKKQGPECPWDASEDYVLIHDAARALITSDLIDHSIAQVRQDKACVMGMPSKDTIRQVDDQGWSKGTPPRRSLWIVHTPQCFVFREILEAFTRLIQEGDGSVTDDGMVMERYGVRSVRMFEGSYENIKITTPDDILTGEAILRKRMKK